jgi:hypothetical protein
VGSGIVCLADSGERRPGDAGHRIDLCNRAVRAKDAQRQQNTRNGQLHECRLRCGSLVTVF